MATSTDAITQNGLTLLPELSSLSRLRYFFGQLITQRDLETEQQYHLVLRRLMQRESLGTGTVAGLRVSDNSNGVTVAGSIFVEPGLALDPDGRELLLENEECILVADTPVVPVSVPFSPAPGDLPQLADEVSARFGGLPFDENDLEVLANSLVTCGLIDSTQASNVDDLAAVLDQVPESTPTLTPPELLRDWLFDQVVGTTYVGLRYRELGTDPAPAVLDASCCGDVTCFPTRTQEGVYIVTSAQTFDAAYDPYVVAKQCLDTQFFGQMDAGDAQDHVSCKSALCNCLLDGWRGMPPTDDPCGNQVLPVVCLAVVCWSRYDRGTLPQILAIDNSGCRPIAPGVPMIRALVESLTGCATPTSLLPRFVMIDPAEDETVSATSTKDNFTISATADAILDVSTNLDDGWELVYYPNETGVPVRYPDTSGLGPGGSNVAIAFADPGSPNGRRIDISFTGGGQFELGTYVWRIFNTLTSPASELESDANSQQLDGEPNPPDAVPSGNGQPGGTFEARFVVA